MLKLALEREGEKRAIAIYRDTNMIAHVWLVDSDDEYRIFEITHNLLKRCYI